MYNSKKDSVEHPLSFVNETELASTTKILRTTKVNGAISKFHLCKFPQLLMGDKIRRIRENMHTFYATARISFLAWIPHRCRVHFSACCSYHISIQGIQGSHISEFHILCNWVWPLFLRPSMRLSSFWNSKVMFWQLKITAHNHTDDQRGVWDLPKVSTNLLECREPCECLLPNTPILKNWL